MGADISVVGTEYARLGVSRAGTSGYWLRTFVVAAGFCWSVAFIAVGVGYELQLFADGSIFSYSVAVEDGWTFHWHNIADRLFVYLIAHVPAETYVHLTKDAHGGILIYGLLFFASQLFGLITTCIADRSEGRIIFVYACLSVACLCPLVFGFPTETWLAHAVFWPALAVCHYANRSIGGFACVLVALFALVFTYDGAPILAVAILATLLLRGVRDAAFARVAGAFLIVMPISAIVRAAFPPDDYFATALVSAALHFFDPIVLTGNMILLLLGGLGSYGIAFLVLQHRTPKAHIYAASAVIVALAVYWLRLDYALHAADRYYLRTVLMIVTPVLGALAVAYALGANDRVPLRAAFLQHPLSALTADVPARALVGALLLVMLVHAVETAKFVTVWRDYEAAVRALAMGTASDPWLGDNRFVSSSRIGIDLNRVSWSSATPFLSVLVTPKFAPTHLVVNPEAGYFWLSCETATRSLNADRAMPAESRRLVRIYSCLHR